jgi:hypothetical protein
MLKKIWLFLCPSLVKLAILLIAITLSLFVVVEREATSKVTWSEKRGIPLPFLAITQYQGPCPPLDFCSEVDVQTLYPAQMLLDVLWWYIASCALFLGYKKVSRRQSPMSSPMSTPPSNT